MWTNVNHLLFFLELQTVNRDYEEKLKTGHTGDHNMFTLSWDIEELKKISAGSHKLYHQINECINECTPEKYQSCNVPLRLNSIRKQLCDLKNRSTHFKRVPATHIFVSWSVRMQET